MSTISLTPPTSPPDQQLLGDPKLSIMPPSSMTGGGNLGGGGSYLGGGMATSSLDAMYGIPEIVAPPKMVANKLAGKNLERLGLCLGILLPVPEGSVRLQLVRLHRQQLDRQGRLMIFVSEWGSEYLCFNASLELFYQK